MIISVRTQSRWSLRFILFTTTKADVAYKGPNFLPSLAGEERNERCISGGGNRNITRVLPQQKIDSFLCRNFRCADESIVDSFHPCSRIAVAASGFLHHLAHQQ